MFHQHISDAVRTTLWQASALWTARTKKEDKTREEADMTFSLFFSKSIQKRSKSDPKDG